MFANIFYDSSTNKIHLWEYENGIRKYTVQFFTPYCFLYDNNGEYKDLFGKKCRRKEFNNYWEQKEFVKSYGVEKVLEGDISPEERFLVDKYYTKAESAELVDLDVHFLDIEVRVEKGFPSPELIENEIQLISIYSTKTKKVHVFGLQPINFSSPGIEYHTCEDEGTLLKNYIDWHRKHYPDVLCGWNSDAFDIPYLINRTEFVLGSTLMKKLSPIGQVQKNGDYYKIAGISQLDYMMLYKNYTANERESYSLNNIASTELKETKLQFEGFLKDLWKTDWNTYVKYNIQDTMLVKKLNDKLGFIKLVQAQAYLTCISLEKYKALMRKFDNYLLITLKDKKIVLPTTKRQSNIELPGAYISEPKRGLFNNVVSFDFTSLYPHIIMGLNISSDTFVSKLQTDKREDMIDIDLSKLKDSESYYLSGRLIPGLQIKKFITSNNLRMSANGCLFKENEGLIPSVIYQIFTKRKSFKKKMQENAKKFEETGEEKYYIESKVFDSFQNAFKILANSLYGQLANPFCRMFDIDFAKSVTLTGQKLTKFMELTINEYFRSLGIDDDLSIYSDTDSAYINFDPVVKKFNTDGIDNLKFIDNFVKTKFLPYMEEQFTYFCKDLHNIPRNYFDLKREVIALNAIFIQKKKYALRVIDEEGLTFSEPKLKVKGLEIVRSSTPKFCREKIKEIVNLIFEVQNKEKIIDKLKEIRTEFKEVPIVDIAFPRGVSDMSKYIKDGLATKGTPIHVRAANTYNFVLRKYKLEDNYEKIHDGDKIKFIYMKDTNPIRENILGFKDRFPSESGLEQYVDKDLQFEKSFMSPILTIGESIGWDLNLDTNDISDLF